MHRCTPSGSASVRMTELRVDSSRLRFVLSKNSSERRDSISDCLMRLCAARSSSAPHLRIAMTTNASLPVLLVARLLPAALASPSRRSIDRLLARELSRVLRVLVESNRRTGTH
jgi:hypothetical protein